MENLFLEFQQDLAQDDNWASMGNMVRYIGGNTQAFANASGEMMGGIESALPKYSSNDAYYTLQVVNTTTVSQSIKLFDAVNTIALAASNYGNPSGTTVTGVPTDYPSYLYRTLGEPRYIQGLKISVSTTASSTPSEQFANPINITFATGEGTSQTETFLPSIFQKETSQNVNLLTIERQFSLPLTASTSVTFTLNATTRINLTFHIASKVSQQNQLQGKPSLEVPFQGGQAF